MKIAIKAVELGILSHHIDLHPNDNATRGDIFDFAKNILEHANMIPNIPDSSQSDLCGDGVCDQHERQTGVCLLDCAQGSVGNPDNFPFCGDNMCDPFERKTGQCLKDCK